VFVSKDKESLLPFGVLSAKFVQRPLIYLNFFIKLNFVGLFGPEFKGALVVVEKTLEKV